MSNLPAVVLAHRCPFYHVQPATLKPTAEGTTVENRTPMSADGRLANVLWHEDNYRVQRSGKGLDARDVWFLLLFSCCPGFRKV